MELAIRKELLRELMLVAMIRLMNLSMLRKTVVVLCLGIKKSLLMSLMFMVNRIEYCYCILKQVQDR